MGAPHTAGNLGSTNAGLTIHTGLAEPHNTYLLAYPLYQHAKFPFEFPHEVSWLP